MSAIKPIIREVKQAVLKGMARSRDDLHQLADNLVKHVDDVTVKVRGQDHFDGPGGNAPSAPHPSANPYHADMTRKPPGMSDQDYLDLLDASVHNPDGLEAILGKYYVPGTSSYVDVAEGRQPPATYFSLGDQWDDIRDSNGLTDDGMFDSFNVPFLERMMAEGKPIGFSHNPQDFPGSALASELDFLQQHGYVFDPKSMQAYLP